MILLFIGLLYQNDTIKTFMMNDHPDGHRIVSCCASTAIHADDTVGNVNAILVLDINPIVNDFFFEDHSILGPSCLVKRKKAH